MEVKGNFKKSTLNVLPNMNRYPRSTSVKFTCIPLNINKEVTLKLYTEIPFLQLQ